VGFFCTAGWIGKDAVTSIVGDGANKVLSSSERVWTIPSFFLYKIHIYPFLNIRKMKLVHGSYITFGCLGSKHLGMSTKA